MTRQTEHILDEYLVLACQGGSRAALDELARRWTPRLLRFAARTLQGHTRASPTVLEAARDVVQDTWLGAIRGLNKLHDPAAFPAWLYGIAHRKCVDWMRSSARRRRIDGAGQSAEAERRTVERELDDGIDLAEAIGRLPQEQRTVVHLYYGEDLGVNDIGRVLDIPAGTVKSRLHHARQELRKHLGEHHGQSGRGHS
jgi:RNA polymerase sigma factor (sigma-70 family)